MATCESACVWSKGNNLLKKDTMNKLVVGKRDYNIISNRYNEFHEEKVLADEDIHRKEAAKRYWKTHEFDPISIQMYDEEKEKTFQKDRDEKAKVHGHNQVKKLPATVQNEGLMYNPVNNAI